MGHDTGDAFWDRFVSFLKGPEGKVLLDESGKRVLQHFMPRVGIHLDEPGALAEAQKDFAFLRDLRKHWERHLDRLVDMDKRMTAAVGRLDEHERICTQRWQEVSEGQKASAQDRAELRKDMQSGLSNLSTSISNRDKAIYGRLWTATGALVVVLLGIISFLAINGSPWVH